MHRDFEDLQPHEALFKAVGNLLGSGSKSQKVRGQNRLSESEGKENREPKSVIEKEDIQNVHDYQDNQQGSESSEHKGERNPGESYQCYQG